MKYTLLLLIGLFLAPFSSFAQSDEDSKSDELKALKEEIESLKKDMKSDEVDAEEISAEEQEAQMDALKQELKAMKKEIKEDKKSKKEMDKSSSDGETKKYDYSIPAQNVFTAEKSMSLGVEPCYVLVVRDMKDKDVKNRWKDYMGKYDTKPKKVKGSKHEQLCQNVTIYDLGYKKYDVYSTVYKTGSDSELVVWLNDGDGFLSEDADNSEGAKKFMSDFGVFIEKYKVDKELEEETKTLKEHNNRQEKLVKEKSKLEKNIAKWEKEIIEAKAEIERNIVDQQNNANEIKNQEEVMKMVRNKVSKF